MAYDSPEEREKAENLAKKLEQILGLARDPDFQEKLAKTVDDAHSFVTYAHEKARYEPLEEWELEHLAELEKMLPVLVSFVQDSQLALGNQLLLAADTYYFHVKHLAEQGDPKAKEAYERLRPLYRDALSGRMEGMN